MELIVLNIMAMTINASILSFFFNSVLQLKIHRELAYKINLNYLLYCLLMFTGVSRAV